MAMSPDQRRRAKDLRLRKVYNISIDEWEALLLSQGNKCPICSRQYEEGKRWSVDHSHVEPYEVRAITCYTCNRYVISSLTIETAWRVYQYLTDPPATRLFGSPRSVPPGMETGMKRRKKRKTVKRDMRKRN